MLEDPIKLAFSKVKQDMQVLSDEITILRQELTENKKMMIEVIGKLKSLENGLETLKRDVSIGNEGVNQSINHLINQSINQQSFNQSINEKEPENTFKEPNKGNDKVNQSFNQSINQQSFNHLINQSQEQILKGVTTDITKTFLSLSKQELKLFLTIYQLEDEGVEPSYRNISTKMQLSEHCIRSHLSSLLRKNTPIVKKRLNNHTNLLSVSREFRALNLKQKLINLYYEADPNQKTLFDVN